MKKLALILDLDNTIYPVSSISDNLFEQLFKLINENAHGIDLGRLEKARHELTRRPFHVVADEFNFSAGLKSKGITLLKEITYHLPMRPYEGYETIIGIPVKKFLVTTGFTKLQWSKIKMLDIEADFEEIHIVDPEISPRTKKDVFADIMLRFNYKPEDILVIGDDPASEIKAAIDLGIDTFLFDPTDMHLNAVATHKAKKLIDVAAIVG